MPAAHKRPDQRTRSLAAAIPAQRDRTSLDQVVADDRWVEALRAGCGDDADDPVIRSLARWRASVVEGT